LVVGVCGIGVLNCGFSPSVCSATVTSLFRRGVARWTPCHEAQRVANAAAIFLTSAPSGLGVVSRPSPEHPAMTGMRREPAFCEHKGTTADGSRAADRLSKNLGGRVNRRSPPTMGHLLSLYGTAVLLRLRMHYSKRNRITVISANHGALTWARREGQNAVVFRKPHACSGY
jgi:hypothetical protein